MSSVIGGPDIGAIVNNIIGQVQASKDAAQADITAQENKLNDLARDLDANFAGFLTGITPPAYKTENANVLVRDPFYGQTQSVMTEKKTSIFPLLAIAAAVYYLFFKKRG